MPSTNIEIVTRFHKAWGEDWKAVIQSFEDHLAEDVRWYQSGFPPTLSRASAIELMQRVHAETGIECIATRITAIAEAHNVVLIEYVGDFVGKDGQLVVRNDIAGVLDLDADGRIRRWSEYFDPRAALALVPMLVDGGQ